MPIKTVLSDLGGVLIDFSVDLAVAAWARQANVDLEGLTAKVVLDELWEQFEVGGVTEAEFCEHVRRKHGFDLTDDELMEGWNSVWLGVNTEVERTLQDVAARGVRVVAVTNTNAAHQRVWQERFAANLGLFSAVYSSWEIQARKPHPAFFERVLDSERVAPHEALFVDDLPENVEGAARVGLDTVLFTDARALRQALSRRGILTG